jgi:hypothetical protein
MVMTRVVASDETNMSAAAAANESSTFSEPSSSLESVAAPPLTGTFHSVIPHLAWIMLTEMTNTGIIILILKVRPVAVSISAFHTTNER